MPLPLLIPVLGATSAAGLLWWGNSEEEGEEPTFSKELYKTLEPVLFIAFVVLVFRWLYNLGSS